MWVEEASTVDISHITRFFTNQQYDKESGLYYYNARYYDPHLGSFITPDPGMDEFNHYTYCNANPVNYIDPTGLSAGYWQTGKGFGVPGDCWPTGKHFGTDSHYFIDGVNKTMNAPVYSKEDGKVIRSEFSNAAGNIVTTQHKDQNGNEYRRSYQHNGSTLVQKGDIVKAGQEIAKAGNKGNVISKPTKEEPDKGAHLHDDKYYLNKDYALKAGYNEKDIIEITWTWTDSKGKEHPSTCFYVPDNPDGSTIDLNSLTKNQMNNEVNKTNQNLPPYMTNNPNLYGSDSGSGGGGSGGSTNNSNNTGSNEWTESMHFY